MKKFLMELIARKKNEMAQLQERSNESQDVAEVRAIGTQLDAVRNEIAEVEAKLAEIEAEEQRNGGIPDNAELRNGVVVAHAAVAGQADDTAYRSAFMNFVLRGTPIPMELRGTEDNENTKTTDVLSVIPTVLVNRIVEKMDAVGSILALVNKTSYAAGVEIPTSSLKPTASWVAEGASSPRQKKTTSKISFTYHKLRCEISMSMEVGTMALAAFEAKFVENVAKAMVKAIEDAIVNGDADGKPKGILAETAPDGQALTVTDGAISYATLMEMEAAIPEEYENSAKWCMSKKTFMKFMGITDDNGQPVARVNFGISGKIERTLLGRDVVMGSAYMPTLAATTANTFAFAFDFDDYTMNTIYDMGISKKQDWDTEDLLTKAVMSVDGKVVDKSSLVTVSNVLSV